MGQFTIFYAGRRLPFALGRHQHGERARRLVSNAPVAARDPYLEVYKHDGVVCTRPTSNLQVDFYRINLVPNSEHGL